MEHPTQPATTPDLQTAAANYRAAVERYHAARASVALTIYSSVSSETRDNTYLAVEDARKALYEARDALAEAALQAPAWLTADADELKGLLAAANQHREDLMRINGEWTAWGAEVLGTHTSDDGYRQAILHMLGAKVGPRQSIAAFLWSEAKRFDNAAETFEQALNASSADRCRVKASHTRTLASQIERGRDMDGEGANGQACKDRVASIVAFLAAEANRYDSEARERSSVDGLPDLLRAYAIMCRTLELAIERGEDLRGGQ